MHAFTILAVLALGAGLSQLGSKKKRARLQYDEFGRVKRIYTGEAFNYLDLDGSVPAVVFLYTGDTAQLDWLTSLMIDWADAYPDVTFYQIPFSLGASIEQVELPVPIVGMAGILGGAATSTDVYKEYITLVDTPDLILEKLDNATTYARGSL